MRTIARALVNRAAWGLETEGRALLENMLGSPSSSGRVVLNQARTYHKNVGCILSSAIHTQIRR